MISKPTGDAILAAIAKRSSLTDLAAYEHALQNHPHHVYGPGQWAKIAAAIEARRSELMAAAEVIGGAG